MSRYSSTITYFWVNYVNILNNFGLLSLKETHPEWTDATRDIVPGDRQRQNSAFEPGIDSIMKHILIGVVVRNGNSAKRSTNLSYFMCALKKNKQLHFNVLKYNLQSFQLKLH